jgi:hypothetical protein
VTDLVFREEPTEYRVTVDGHPGLVAGVHLDDDSTKWVAANRDGYMLAPNGSVAEAGEVPKWLCQYDKAEDALAVARLALAQEVHSG